MSLVLSSTHMFTAYPIHTILISLPSVLRCRQERDIHHYSLVWRFVSHPPFMVCCTELPVLLQAHIQQLLAWDSLWVVGMGEQNLSRPGGLSQFNARFLPWDVELNILGTAILPHLTTGKLPYHAYAERLTPPPAHAPLPTAKPTLSATTAALDCPFASPPFLPPGPPACLPSWSAFLPHNHTTHTHMTCQKA